MNAPRGRILLASAVGIGLLVTSWVLPVAAAECALSAPAIARVGTTLTILGSGFPPSANVDIEWTVDGGNADEFSLQSNSSGSFEIALTPEPIDEGDTTVIATAGSACTAQVQFTVLGENEPAPTAEPEEAGAGATAAPEPPTTDAAAPSPGASSAGFDAWLVGTIIFLIGVVGLLTTRPARGRSGR
jgi:hypothetical protein